MLKQGITHGDVCEVSGYSRDELHALLKVLPPYCDAQASPRKARQYLPRDLLTFCVARVLEHDLGLRRAAMGRLGEALQKALTGPRKINPQARLVITVEPPQVTYVAQCSTDRQGAVVALGPLFAKVDGYLCRDVYPSLRLETALSSAASKGRHA